MSKYLLVYQGQVDPSANQGPPDDAVMQAWTSWGDKVGSSMVDFGSPTAGSTRVGGSGAALPITGYTIVESGSLEEARTLCDAHPFLQEAPADFSIDVYELLQM